MRSKRLVLVTRPEPGLSEVLEKLNRLGWQGVACPVFRIIHLAPFPPLDCKAILLTSGQALPALSEQPRSRMLFTVGEKTAERARQMGFVNVYAAGGNAESLKKTCLEQNLTGLEVVLARGQGWQRQDYGKEISEQLCVTSLCAYKVERVKKLPEEAIRGLHSEAVDSVMFYSGETFLSFMEICPKTTLTYLKNVRAVCYSEAIAHKALASGFWSSVLVSPYPLVCPE